jgi:predicted dehydrogenase
MTTNHRFLRAAARPLNIGIVGLGYWGPNLLRVLSELEQARVSHICDLDDTRVDRFSRRFPAALATTRIDDLLGDPELDAVVIATPVFTHAELASRALIAGKHVLVEKPLATSSEDADDLVRLAADNDLVLMCGHTFVYSPPVRAIKGLLDAKELGEIFFVSSSRVNLGLHQPDVSVIWDLGPHDFSILLHWLGEMPRAVRAVGRDSIVPGIPDVAFVNLTYESGIVANVELSWLAPSKLRRTVVVGSEKMVVYEDGAAEPVRIFDHGVVYKDPETFGEYQLSYRTGDILSPKVDTHEPLMSELTDFTKVIREGGETVASAQMARDVVRLIEAADESLQRGGAEIVLDRDDDRDPVFVRTQQRLAVG